MYQYKNSEKTSGEMFPLFGWCYVGKNLDVKLHHIKGRSITADKKIPKY